MFRKLALLIIVVAGCGVSVEIEGIEKLDALLDSGVTVHIEGIPEGGVPVRFLQDPSPENTDDAGE